MFGLPLMLAFSLTYLHTWWLRCSCLKTPFCWYLPCCESELLLLTRKVALHSHIVRSLLQTISPISLAASVRLRCIHDTKRSCRNSVKHMRSSLSSVHWPTLWHADGLLCLHRALQLWEHSLHLHWSRSRWNRNDLFFTCNSRGSSQSSSRCSWTISLHLLLSLTLARTLQLKSRLDLGGPTCRSQISFWRCCWVLACSLTRCKLDEAVLEGSEHTL